MGGAASHAAVAELAAAELACGGWGSGAAAELAIGGCGSVATLCAGGWAAGALDFAACVCCRGGVAPGSRGGGAITGGGWGEPGAC